MNKDRLMGRTGAGGLFGNIEVRRLPSGKQSVRYRYSFYDELGRRVWKFIDCRGDLRLAKQVQLEVTKKWLAGEVGRPSRFKLVSDDEIDRHTRLAEPVESFKLLYLDRLRNEGRSVGSGVETQSFKTHKKFVERFFEIVAVERMGDLAREDVDTRYKNARKAQVSVASINREYHCLRKMLRYAFEEGYIREDLAKKVRLMRETDHEVVILPSLEFIVNMLQSCAAVCADFTPLLWLYLKTGCRRAEGIEFRKSWVRRDDRRFFIHQSKTGKLVRPVVDPDMHALAYALLDDPKNTTDHLCIDEHGKQWTETKIRRRFKVIRAAMGLSDEEGERLVCATTLRHTYASAISKMFGIEHAAEYCGHSSINLTRKYYANVYIPYVDKTDRVLPWNIFSIHGHQIGHYSLDSNTFGSVLRHQNKSGLA